MAKALYKEILELAEDPLYRNKPYSIAVKLGCRAAYVVEVLKSKKKLKNPNEYGDIRRDQPPVDRSE